MQNNQKYSSKTRPRLTVSFYKFIIYERVFIYKLFMKEFILNFHTSRSEMETGHLREICISYILM